MYEYHNTIWCASCGAEILYPPYVNKQQKFCCQDCALGFSCKCGKAMERRDDYWDANHPLESTYSEGSKFYVGSTSQF